MDILHEEWAQGIKVALKAYGRASDAYAQNIIVPSGIPSVALWSVLIAAGVVLLEWLVSSRYDIQH
jgi:hypothetical protein